MKLTSAKVKSAEGKEKSYKLADSGGLYLLVKPNGRKYWRLKYRIGAKEKLLALGVYPTLSLKAARSAQDKAKLELRSGFDPAELRRTKRLEVSEVTANSFRVVSDNWFETKMLGKSKTHQERTRGILDKHLLPSLAHRPLAEVTAPDLLGVLRKIEATGAHYTAHRACQVFGLVARFSIASGLADRDVSVDLKGALVPPKKKHFAAITTPAQAGELMSSIANFDGAPVAKAALKISPLLFQRPGEIRHMEWSEVDLHAGVWEIPAEKMKMDAPHMVPLSKQAVEILTQLQPLTGRSLYTFPLETIGLKPMTENTVRLALRKLGYSSDQHTPHGFRAMARTLLDEVLGFRVDWIEMQLAHRVKDPNGRAYNRTKYLEQRRHMMQRWADYLDELRLAADHNNVVVGTFKNRELQ